MTKESDPRETLPKDCVPAPGRGGGTKVSPDVLDLHRNFTDRDRAGYGRAGRVPVAYALVPHPSGKFVPVELFNVTFTDVGYGPKHVFTQFQPEHQGPAAERVVTWVLERTHSERYGWACDRVDDEKAKARRRARKAQQKA